MKADKTSNEKLLKRAKNGSRNLYVLGILAMLVGGVISFIGIMNKVDSYVLAIGIGALVAGLGYIFMAISAGRGFVKSLYFTVVFLALILAVTTFSLLVGNAEVKFPNFILPIIILILIYRNYKDVIELKERGLHEIAFGARKNGKFHCILGIIFLISGFIGVHGATYLTYEKMKDSQRLEERNIDILSKIFQNEEKILIDSLNTPEENNFPKKQKVLSVIKVLKTKVESLHQDNLKHDFKFSKVTSLYLQAVKSWNKGIEELFSENPDFNKAKKQFELGDTLKKTAIERFNKLYMKPN